MIVSWVGGQSGLTGARITAEMRDVELSYATSELGVFPARKQERQ